MSDKIGGGAFDCNDNPIFDGNYVWYHGHVLIVEKIFSTAGGHYADLLTVDNRSVPYISTRMLVRATQLEYLEHHSRDRAGVIPATTDLRLGELRKANVKRCEQAFHPLNAWSPTDWACAMAGEVGETCNLVKKLRRFDDATNTEKDPSSRDETVDLIGKEIADAIIYADLLAARLGIDLSQVIRSKFNEVSERMKSEVRL